MNIDLRANPFFLTEEDCDWVHETIAAMNDEEKVGQLFFQLTSSQKEEDLIELIQTYHLGGCRYNPAPAREVWKQNRILQENSKIPLFIACNTLIITMENAAHFLELMKWISGNNMYL